MLIALPAQWSAYSPLMRLLKMPHASRHGSLGRRIPSLPCQSKSPLVAGQKVLFGWGRISRRKDGEQRWWWGEPGRTEREQERRTGRLVELVGPGAAVSAVRFPVAASSERAQPSGMRSWLVALRAVVAAAGY